MIRAVQLLRDGCIIGNKYRGLGDLATVDQEVAGSKPVSHPSSGRCPHRHFTPSPGEAPSMFAASGRRFISSRARSAVEAAYLAETRWIALNGSAMKSLIALRR